MQAIRSFFDEMCIRDRDKPWGLLLAGLGLLTMFVGALLALFSVNLKRTLACSSVSQIGFIPVSYTHLDVYKRQVLGPGISDRIIAVNMTGTMIIMVIAILSVFLNENYLVDVCLIYAMISFLGVVVLCKVYTGVYLQKKNLKADLGAIEDNLNRQNQSTQDQRAQEQEVSS